MNEYFQLTLDFLSIVHVWSLENAGPHGSVGNYCGYVKIITVMVNIPDIQLPVTISYRTLMGTSVLVPFN